MATVVHRTTKELRRSVNTPDFDVADWIINPDLSAVRGQPSKYWVITGDSVTLMDQAARDVVDAAEAAAILAANRAAEKARYDNERLIRAVVLVKLDEINAVRAASALPARTAAQLKTAIESKIDSI